MSEKTETTGMLTKIERQGEVAIAAMAAKAKAEVEARYVIALQRPRNINQARITILDACKRPRFAEGARYRKPVGGKGPDGRPKTVDGLSIRFAEEALKAMTNIVTDSTVVWEDDQKRNIKVTVTDLESNTTYADDIIVAKTVERKFLKEGQEKLGERVNSYGDKVFLVAATEEDMTNKVNAAKSKIIRNNGLRLVPQDILEEAEETILATLAKGGGDPKAETKKVCDAFASIGVKPTELEHLLGHSLETISPKELVDLRATYSAIKDEETTWAEVIATAGPKRPAQTGPPTADPAAAAESAAAIDAKAIEKPYEYIKGLCEKDKVSEDQVHAHMKILKLAGDKTVELQQASDSNLRKVIGQWNEVLPKIKAITI